jgi:hypothetical protein
MACGRCRPAPGRGTARPVLAVDGTSCRRATPSSGEETGVQLAVVSLQADVGKENEGFVLLDNLEAIQRAEVTFNVEQGPPATQLFITVTLRALGIGQDAMTAPPQVTAGLVKPVPAGARSTVTPSQPSNAHTDWEGIGKDPTDGRDVRSRASSQADRTGAVGFPRSEGIRDGIDSPSITKVSAYVLLRAHPGDSATRKRVNVNPTTPRDSYGPEGVTASETRRIGSITDQCCK